MVREGNVKQLTKRAALHCCAVSRAVFMALVKCLS